MDGPHNGTINNNRTIDSRNGRYIHADEPFKWKGMNEFLDLLGITRGVAADLWKIARVGRINKSLRGVNYVASRLLPL
jgi:hypothetical protein